jgi:uncharacterized protein
MKKIILASIRLYQKYLSPDTGVFRSLWILGSGSCRYFPTCSEYTYQAVERYGIIYGLWLGVKRIVRCNPWHEGGLDQVPETVN